MSGRLLSLLEMATYDFSDIGTSGTIEQLVVPNIDVSNWPRAELLMRVHSKTITGASTVFGVELRRALPSPQDPSRTFEQAGTGAAQAAVNVNSAAAPLLVIDDVNAPLGSYLNLYVIAVQSATPGSINATISVELVLKD